jgi:hypothetical protein
MAGQMLAISKLRLIQSTLVELELGLSLATILFCASRECLMNNFIFSPKIFPPKCYKWVFSRENVIIEPGALSF